MNKHDILGPILWRNFGIPKILYLIRYFDSSKVFILERLISKRALYNNSALFMGNKKCMLLHLSINFSTKQIIPINHTLNMYILIIFQKAGVKLRDFDKNILNISHVHSPYRRLGQLDRLGQLV